MFKPSDVVLLNILMFSDKAGNQKAYSSSYRILILTKYYSPTKALIHYIYNTKLSKCTHKFTNIRILTSYRLKVVYPNNYYYLIPLRYISKLLIEGPLVSRGYLNDPIKTNTVFVKNLVWANDKELPARARRFYNTGDLIHYHANGTLQYLGHKDSVKVHGHRIELGEIETQIKSLIPNIK